MSAKSETSRFFTDFAKLPATPTPAQHNPKKRPWQISETTPSHNSHLCIIAFMESFP
jgi:hypothetical protein